MAARNRYIVFGGGCYYCIMYGVCLKNTFSLLESPSQRGVSFESDVPTATLAETIWRSRRL